MRDPQSLAIRFLSARGDVAWRWVDDGNVVAWCDGTTVAFREEIIFVLEWLIPQGWPDFGALVWLLAACRGALPPALSETLANSGTGARGIAAGNPRMEKQLAENRVRTQRWCRGVEDGLLAVSRLPAEDACAAGPRSATRSAVGRCPSVQVARRTSPSPSVLKRLSVPLA